MSSININFILYLFIILTSLPINSFSQQLKLDEGIVDAVCGVSKDNSAEILSRLMIKQVNNNDRSLEIYKEVYSEAMSDELLRLQRVVKKDKNQSTAINAMLGMAEVHYKFGLCEKYKRNNALPSTIMNEYYFLCRKGFLTNQSHVPAPCF